MKTSLRPAHERVSWCLETSSIMTPFPGRVSVPSSFVSLFILYILSHLLSKTMGCFSGCLMSSASSQKLFCEVCSAFKCCFDEFVGEKVVSPSYSSAIFAPPRQLNFFMNFFLPTVLGILSPDVPIVLHFLQLYPSRTSLLHYLLRTLHVPGTVSRQGA